MILDALAVAAGGAVGALLRFGLILGVAARAQGTAGPWDPGARATFLANIGGCALFGLWIAAAAAGRVGANLAPGIGDAVDLFVLTGVCGGWTTFSTVVADDARLRIARGRRSAFTYAAASLLAGTLALWVGLHLGG